MPSTPAKRNGSGLFLWSSSGACCGFETKANGTAPGPLVITKRHAALDAAAKRVQLFLRLNFIHPGTPVPRQRWIIGNCQPAAFVCTLEASISRTPLPVFRKLNQICTHWISLHVPHHRQQVPVCLDGKRFEASLIKMSRATGCVMSMPTHRVHYGEATEELADLIAGFGPDYEMPVIGHCHHGINRQRHDFPRFLHNTHERGIIFRLFKNREPSHRSIQNVENFTSRTNAFRACHAGTLTHN